MKPRDFLNFFKTKSGKLVLFAVIFGGGLLIFSTLRDRSRSRGEIDIHVTRPQKNPTDKPQVVQTIERPIQPFHPPPPKPEPPPAPPAKANQPRMVVVEKPKPEPPPAALAAISLFADSTAGVSEPKNLGSVYAPFGRLISCETVITVDSASIQTPIIGLVTENFYHAGKLVIPAGTEVHGTAQTDHYRERIASGTSWTLVWQSGEELRLKAIALDREFETSTNQVGWGITDGSAGLRGELIKSDSLAEIKLFAATFLSGAAGALTETQPTLFGPVASPTLNNAPLQGAQAVLQTYAKRIYDSIQRDGFYVRVPSGKQFYLYVLQTLDRSEAVIGGTLKPFADQEKTNTPAVLPTAAFSVGPTPTPDATRANSTPLF